MFFPHVFFFPWWWGDASFCGGLCMQAEVKAFSYIRVVWILTGQFLKSLECGHTPHVTEWIQIQNTSQKFLYFLNLFPVVSVFSFTCLARSPLLTFTSAPVLLIFHIFHAPSLPHLFTHTHRLINILILIFSRMYLRFVTASGFSFMVSLWFLPPVMKDPSGI